MGDQHERVGALLGRGSDVFRSFRLFRFFRCSGAVFEGFIVTGRFVHAEFVGGDEGGVDHGGIGGVQGRFDDGVAIEDLARTHFRHGWRWWGNVVFVVCGGGADFGVDGVGLTPGEDSAVGHGECGAVVDQHVDVTVNVGGSGRGEHVDEVIGLVKRERA